MQVVLLFHLHHITLFNDEQALKFTDQFLICFSIKYSAQSN